MSDTTVAEPTPPVWRGRVFCSSWCGFGCSRAAYDRACLEAAALVARMGYGWKSEIWENAGWYYRVVKGRTALYADTVGDNISGKWAISSFTARITLAPLPDTVGPLQFVHSADTPEDALRSAVETARVTVQRIGNALTEILYDGPDDATGRLLPGPAPGVHHGGEHGDA